MKYRILSVTLVSLFAGFFCFNSFKIQAQSDPLSDPYPQDNETAVAKVLKSTTDTDFLNSYILLSALEKDELENIFEFEPLTFNLIKPLQKMRFEFFAQIAEMMTWVQLPIALNEPETFSKVFALSERPRRLSMLVVRASCRSKELADTLVPPKTEPKLLDLSHSIPVAPRDFAQKCERSLDFYLQKSEGVKVRQEKLLNLSSSSLAEFWRSAEQPQFLKRLWITAERWESESNVQKKFSLRLRSIDTYSYSLNVEQTKKYQKLASFLREIENSGERGLEPCALLDRFYEFSKAPVRKSELGLCLGKVIEHGVDRPLAAISELPKWNRSLLAKSSSGELKAYALEIRKMYTESLQKIPANKTEHLRKAMNQQIREFKVSVLVAQLFELQASQAAGFDPDAEALRQVKKNRQIASLNARSKFDLQSAQSTLDIVTALKAELKSKPTGERETLEFKLSLHEGLCRAVIKALEKNF